MRATLALALVSCATCWACAAPPPPPVTHMPAPRHCHLALAQAQAGDCLTAGEHLAYCRGAEAQDTRAATQQLCSAKATAESAPPPTTPAPPSTRPPLARRPAPPPIAAPPLATPPPISAPPPPQPSPPPTVTQPSSAVLPLHDPKAGRACDEAITAAQRGSCGVARVQLLSCRGAKEASAQATVTRLCLAETW